MPDEPERGDRERVYSINLHVPGILTLLSEHLYSNPGAALREMLQNAHDSCLRRLAEDPAAATYTPRIDVTLNPDRRLLTIRDNGSGLTADEIHGYLATVGRSYTGELRDRLAFGGREQALSLIGQFGLGLLSAFIVADRVEMVTRSFQPGSPAWRWTSTGEGSYTLAPARREEPGSTFTLHLKLEGEFLLNEDVVRQAIRTYADFLEVPIHLNGSRQPVNAMDAPWHRGGSMADYRRYVVDRFDVLEPLAVIPLHDHVETVTLPDGSQDAIITPLAGVLFVPTGSVVSIREYGEVAVYIRRMFITDEERDLLPRWARFVSGVVESPVLRPTVSREQVRRDEAFYRVQHAIEEQLLAFFQELAERDPAAWRNIVLVHNDLIKAWALESRVFFETICDLVTFDTSRGRMTLPDYLDATGGAIYYFAEAQGSTQEKMLYEARGLPVVDASVFVEEAFLQAYARSHPGVELRQLEPGASFVFSDVADPSPRWEKITRYYTEQGIRVRVVRFEPESIPAILVYPPGSDDIAGARAALESGEITGAVARLVEEYLRTRDPAQAAAQGILHLNAACPLMQRLLTLSPDSGVFTAALEIVYHNARFFAGRSLTASEARQSFDMISYSLSQLLEALRKPTGHEPDSASSGADPM